MSEIIETIDLDVPVSTAYNQWTQFEKFPEFMEGVVSIKQTDDTHLHWETKIAGVERSFDAEITEQKPDERIAWRNTTGASHAGVVTFHHLAEGKSRVALQLDIEPEGVVETVGDAIGMAKRRIKGDLDRFKDLIEGRKVESGAWRGTVDHSPRT